ncbi:hypothetical protein TNCV_1090661 [Trichonephila clavipes]|uniref:Uncharacterized protein n=1 Tax=Trichonephila clavipes TaxID=2585209 RepID=A0A8X6SXH3_TRICX|nr:hypothetical protein TNCV_1090661 [Trichonephila clavipes]
MRSSLYCLLKSVSRVRQIADQRLFVPPSLSTRTQKLHLAITIFRRLEEPMLAKSVEAQSLHVGMVKKFGESTGLVKAIKLEGQKTLTANRKREGEKWTVSDVLKGLEKPKEMRTKEKERARKRRGLVVLGNGEEDPGVLDRDDDQES